MHVIAGVLAAPNKVYKGATVSIWADVAGTCIDGAFEFSVCRVAFGMVASPPTGREGIRRQRQGPAVATGALPWPG